MAVRNLFLRHGRGLTAIILAISFLIFAACADASTVLYYSQSYSPYQMRYVDLADPGASYTIHTSETGTFKAVAVDRANLWLYFSDPVEGKIYRSRFDSSDRTVYLSGVYAEGIALDAARNYFYYTQAHTDSSDHYNVMRADLANPSTATEIYTSPTGTPEAIAVAANGDVYFSDKHDTVAKIFKVAAGTTSPVEFLTGVHAFGLAVEGEYLYLSEAYDPNFELIRVKLSDKSIIEPYNYTSATGAPGAMTVFGGELYFADMHSTVAKLFKTSLSGATTSDVLSGVNPGGVALLYNFPPVLVMNAGITTNENTREVIGSWALLATDPDATDPVFILGTAPTKGDLTKNGTPLAAGGTFSQGDINGGLIWYVPNANISGNDSFSFTVSDGMGESTASAAFSISINSVNDAPSFTKGADQTVLEDAGAQTVSNWATGISAGFNQSDQTLSFTVTNDNNALFSAQPAVSAYGALTYTPADDAYGSATVSVTITDDGGTANGGEDTSASQTFIITVTAVNDAPSFTKGADQTVPEDAGAQTANGWATGISAGPNESGQTLSFNVVNDNNALFSVQPAVSPGGALTFTPAANANGSAMVTLYLQDNGGTDNSGVDTTASQTFTITVTAVNDAPSFTKGADQTAPEDAGTQTVNGWATGVITGPADESGQTYEFSTTNDNNNLFAVQPLVAHGGNLTFTPAPDAYGSAAVSVTITDNGSTDNGGVDSYTHTFTINVTGVNDVPSFVKGADQTVFEDAGPRTVAGWATGISAGPKNEAGQTLSFTVANDNNALFSVQPAVAADGTLTFTPTANANGSATVTLYLRDSGGTNNGGVDTTASQTFTINVIAVNDAPTITKGADQTVLEDAGPRTVVGWATGISAGPNEAGQTLSFTIENNNNALFSVQPQVAPDGTLTFTPVPEANGSATVTLYLQDSGGTDNGGADTAMVTFTITVNEVNEAPVFTKGPNQEVLEDAGAQTVTGWATGISAGPNEAGQTLTFNVTNNNSALFSEQPAVAANGTLTYTPAANASGSATVTIISKDDGGTANGGSDTSAAQIFIIKVTAVNDAPTLTRGADQNVLENCGAQTVTGWAANISPGPQEDGQVLTITVTNDNNNLFSVQPSVAANGTLTYTPAADANGSATVTIVLKDDGGTAYGGVDNFTVTFTITVTGVNVAPSFIMGADQVVAEDAGPQTVASWATEVSAGPNESEQTLNFIVTNNNGALFSEQPAVAIDGTLTYAPANDASGSAQVTVTLQDNGGTANGGVDHSTGQNFTITVTAVNDAPTISVPQGQSILQDTTLSLEGASAIVVADTDAGDGLVSARITVNNGTFSLINSINALDFSTGDGTDDASMEFTGKISDINTALNGLTYTPEPGFSGFDTLAIILNDQGRTGSGGAQAASGAVEITVVSLNKAPILSGITPEAGPTGSIINFGLTFTDPDGLMGESYQVTWSWGDGSNDTIYKSQGDGNLSARHVYDKPGSYTLSVKIEDTAGGIGQSVQMVMVSDRAISARGSGIFASPAGAVAAQPDLAGYASFIFVSNYGRDRSTPSGAMAFTFHKNKTRILFTGESQKWLVVSGNKILLQGTGRLNGKRGYNYTLSAADFDRLGRSDRFRLQITDNNGQLVYDNEPAKGIYDMPDTTLRSGNITIKK